MMKEYNYYYIYIYVLFLGGGGGVGGGGGGGGGEGIDYYCFIFHVFPPFYVFTNEIPVNLFCFSILAKLPRYQAC